MTGANPQASTERDTTGSTIVPRFEFRIFATGLGMAEQRMRAIAPCDAVAETREIYLIGHRLGLDGNVKIRHGKLELKRLIEHYQGLQRWQPAGQWEFPVAPVTIADILNQAVDQQAPLSRDELLGLAAQPVAQLHRVNVYKLRFHFILGECHAEYDRLLVNGAATESIAIEAGDPQAVLQAQSALHLGDYENQSYPLALSRFLGIAPLPREQDYG